MRLLEAKHIKQRQAAGGRRQAAGGRRQAANNIVNQEPKSAFFAFCLACSL